MNIPLPPQLDTLSAGTQLKAGHGIATILADFDFETYSPAGYVWKSHSQTWGCLLNTKIKGLSVVGAAVYTQHPDAEVLSLAYNLKDGRGKRQWIPGQPHPQDLFDHIARGELLEAWNVSFEYWVWVNICQPKYGWPRLSSNNLRCAMAKARAFSLPGGLDKAAEVLGTKNRKNPEGKRLLDKFSKPRNPTKTDDRVRILPNLNDPDTRKLYEYNIQDITVEAECSSLIPDLRDFELKFWQCDQIINRRGVQIDTESIKNCIIILEQITEKYNEELCSLTNGAVTSASQVPALKTWLYHQHDLLVDGLDEDKLQRLLNRPNLHKDVRRVLQIRQLLGSAAVKKLYTMLNQATSKGRLHDLFIYHSARTGRTAGAGPQPQNLPNSGPAVLGCNHKKEDAADYNFCGKYSINKDNICAWCGKLLKSYHWGEWNATAVKDALETMASGASGCIEYYWDEDILNIVAGCLRGLFIAAPHHILIGSDYSAIEAVVLAALAGEEWRLDVFRTHGKIYEMSASKITGIPFEEFEEYKNRTGQHHPMRKKIGKVAELASGYQGWIGAWKQFGADEFFNDDEIKHSILQWRFASPKIVEMWGGQSKNWKTEYYGLEGCAISALLFPDVEFEYRGIKCIVNQGILYIRLLSGRYLTYHKAKLEMSQRRANEYAITFEGWNTNPKNGGIGWIRMNTYGGRLTENIVQATARDVLANAIINLEKYNYPVVLQVHDEIIAEIPINFGSVKQFETIMSTMPVWAKDWPIKASGGWLDNRYRKD